MHNLLEANILFTQICLLTNSLIEKASEMPTLNIYAVLNSANHFLANIQEFVYWEGSHTALHFLPHNSSSVAGFVQHSNLRISH